MSKRGRRSRLLALAAVVGLSGALFLQTRGPEPARARAVGAPHEAEPADEEPAGTPVTVRADAEATREMIERPLFFQSRRPMPPEPAVVAEVKPPPPPVLDFSLVGTVVAGTSKVALVKPDKAPPLQVEAGQAVGGWTVTSIDFDRIMVRHGATEQLVAVRDFDAARPLPAAMRPAPAQKPPPPPRPVAQPAAQASAGAGARR